MPRGSTESVRALARRFGLAWSEREVITTAYHEAGHAVAHLVQGDTVRSVTIVPEGAFLGRCFATTHWTEVGDLDPQRAAPGEVNRTRIAIEEVAVSTLAGPLAEARFRHQGIYKIRRSREWLARHLAIKRKYDETGHQTVRIDDWDHIGGLLLYFCDSPATSGRPDGPSWDEWSVRSAENYLRELVRRTRQLLQPALARRGGHRPPAPGAQRD